MKAKIGDLVKDALDQACQEVRSFLPPATLDKEGKAKILKKYVAAIEGNFVAWMGAAAICTRSVQGRYAASENLWVEMKDDHAGMLRDFATSARCEPGVEDYQAVSEPVARIRALVARLSGLECLVLMAVLENASGVFIPWLESAAKELGSTNLRYTQVHGEADIAHADQFAWAVTHEMELYENPEKLVEASVQVTTDLLKGIFQV
jgi:hypothetical protein